MTSAMNGRFAAAVTALVFVVAGCATNEPEPPPGPSSPTSTRAMAAPTTPPSASQIDARWIGLDTSQPWNWEEVDRTIARDFQQFGFRPVGENELPRRCNGCGVNPPTASLTVYAPGKFDPTDVRTSQPVSVVGDDGFFRPMSQGLDVATLAWQYADNAWATVRGKTTMSSELDRLLELARAVRPTDRTLVRVPMSLPGLPAQLPLAEINIDNGRYGTSLLFGACGVIKVSGVPECQDEGSDHLRVQIWPTDGYSGHIQETRTVPLKIGDKDGLYDEPAHEAAVQVQPGMLVVFGLGGRYGVPVVPPTANFKDILANVAWPADPRNEETWPPVSQWAK